MDSKTVLVVCAVLIVAGSIVKDALSIAGLTKTKVEGGAGVEAAFFLATGAIFIGWGIFLALLVTNGGYIADAMSCLFGGTK